MTDDEILGKFVKGVMDDAPTFSDDMMAKVREELLRASKEAEEHYRREGAGD